MARQIEERDVYRIPENFVDTGTVMGGMFKLRNVIEAGTIAAVFILPLFKIGISLTAKIIIACLTALPLGLLALIGVNGESLTCRAALRCADGNSLSETVRKRGYPV